MSYVTDLVFVYPADADDWRETDDQNGPYCEAFEDMFARHHYAVRPTEEGPGKPSGTAVYHVGVNYLRQELIDEIRRQSWPDGTVLYLFDEHDDSPKVTVWPVSVDVPAGGEA